MKTSALDNKTIRPGLDRYSFYSSPVSSAPAKKAKASNRHKMGKFLAVVLILVVAGAGATYALKPSKVNTVAVKKPAVSSTTKTNTTNTPSTPAVAPAPVNNCEGNTLDQLIKVSISERHLWACDGTQEEYNTPVVTGIEYLAADLTPVGTYHIYGKYTDTTLTGSDTTGSWNDYVNYWMPFLHNQYGSYGLHDATWRSPTDFGNISPNSANASHGCVELPLGAAKWLYDWASIGTTVTVQS